MNKDERKKYDSDILNILVQLMSYSLPYTDTDLAKLYYQGQQSMLVKLSKMMVSIPVGGVCQPMITEEILNKMIKETNDELANKDKQ
jgi:hypothetical protein